MLALLLQSLAPTTLGGVASKLPDTPASTVLVAAAVSIINILLVPGGAIVWGLVAALGGGGTALQPILASVANPIVYGVTAAAIGGRVPEPRKWRIGVACFWAVWLALGVLVALGITQLKPD